MKVLLELLVIVILLAAGWNQPYRLHFERLFDTDAGASVQKTHATQTAPRYRPAGTALRTTPAPDNSWLWEPTILDPKRR